MWAGRRSVLRQQHLLLQRRPQRRRLVLAAPDERASARLKKCVSLCGRAWLAVCRYVLDADSPGTLDPSGSHK